MALWASGTSDSISSTSFSMDRASHAPLIEPVSRTVRMASRRPAPTPTRCARVVGALRKGWVESPSNDELDPTVANLLADLLSHWSLARARGAFLGDRRC